VRDPEGELTAIWDSLAATEADGGIGGAFDRDMARARAEALVEQNVPVERALERAAREQRAYEERLRHEGATAYQDGARQLREGGPDPVGDGAPPVSTAPLNQAEQIQQDIKDGKDPFEEQLKRSQAAHGAAA
jgi:hypothetical protein